MMQNRKTEPWPAWAALTLAAWGRASAACCFPEPGFDTDGPFLVMLAIFLLGLPCWIAGGIIARRNRSEMREDIFWLGFAVGGLAYVAIGLYGLARGSATGIPWFAAMTMRDAWAFMLAHWH